jgi:hypothetical protein
MTAASYEIVRRPLGGHGERRILERSVAIGPRRSRVRAHAYAGDFGRRDAFHEYDADYDEAARVKRNEYDALVRHNGENNTRFDAIHQFNRVDPGCVLFAYRPRLRRSD